MGGATARTGLRYLRRGVHGEGWAEGEGGAWDFFDGMALGGSHVRETGEEGVAWERQLHAIRDLA